MNIGVDARLLHDTTGIGRYTRSLFFEYTQANRFKYDRLVLFSDKPFHRFPERPGVINNAPGKFPENVDLVITSCKRRILWTNWYLPPLLRRHNIDVYHGVCNFELPMRKMCRYVVTIHDLVPLFFPELVPKKHLLFFKLFMKRAAWTADLIITDSLHSKRDIVRYFNVPEEKIRVIYLGYDTQYQEIHDLKVMQNVLARYGIHQPYLLFVGVIEPKKNLERLVDAFRLLRENSSLGKTLQLVIAGGKGWLSEQLYRKIEKLSLEKQIVLPGFIPEYDLPALYSGAELFVFPSIYEGFGLPVLEAMSCGTPVLTSSVSSLPEIVGNAGFLVDPYDSTAICQGIVTVLSDSQKRAQMRQAGYIQAQKFSWKRTAEQTYAVYREAYEMSR